MWKNTVKNDKKYCSKLVILAKKLVDNMLGKSPNQNQKSFFNAFLKDIVNPNEALIILSDKIPWKEIEQYFSKLYSNTGQPSKPIRLMAGLLILKQMFNLGDETLMPQWVQNPYYQYFCGESEFQWRPPCDPSDLVHFRKRIGEDGVSKILEISVKIQDPEDLKGDEVIIDTTVQEKNITFPTDSKLYVKIIEKCNETAFTEHLKQRRSYKREVGKLLFKLRLAHHPKRYKEGKAAIKRLKTIAGCLLRELERKLAPEKLQEYEEQLKIFHRILEQQKNSKDKVYSIHEPETACIAKGKTGKKYEFGSKVSFGILPKSNIIVGVKIFTGNPHDSKTLEPTLENIQKITGRKFKSAIVDRGYPGKKKIGETTIIMPGKPEKSPYQKQKKRRQCRSRAAIEPVIGHVKEDCRMSRNYLKGTTGDIFNATMASAAFNFRHLLNKIRKSIFCAFYYLQFFFKIFNLLSFYKINNVSFDAKMAS